MKQGTLFLLLTLLCVAGVAALVVLPDARSRIDGREDALLIRTLQQVAVAQALTLRAATIDRDENGAAEFAFLGELQAANRPDLPLLSPDRLSRDAEGRFRLGPYVLESLLPDATGLPVTEAQADRVDPLLATRAWLLAALPVGREGAGRPAWIIGPDCIVHEEMTPGAGRREGALSIPRMALAEPTGRIVLIPLSPRAWRPFLPAAQRTWILDQFSRHGLEPPRGMRADPE